MAESGVSKGRAAKELDEFLVAYRSDYEAKRSRKEHAKKNGNQKGAKRGEKGGKTRAPKSDANATRRIQPAQAACLLAALLVGSAYGLWYAWPWLSQNLHSQVVRQAEPAQQSTANQSDD